MTGAIPRDFVWVHGERRVVLVLGTMQRTLGRSLVAWAHAPPPDGVRLPGGRGATYRVSLEDGETVAVRLCRRGGLLGGVLGDLYWGGTPRPFAEVAALEEARRRGVPAPAALGARIDRLRGGWYRGMVVTRYLPGVQPFWEALAAAAPADREKLAHAAGQVGRRLCEARVLHADFNLRNCVVRGGGGGFEAFAVDFDRARTADATPPAILWERLVERVERSARRLDPRGEVATAEVMRVLCAAARPEP
jgi:hypothetical protein